MEPIVRRRSGSGGQWEREWREAAAREALESPPRRSRIVLVALFAGAAALAAGLFPLTPGFSAADTKAAVIAALVVAALSVAVVAAAALVGRTLPRAGAADVLVFAVALVSAGAGAIHLSVAQMHFDEYFLFGLFFVGSGVAQFVWPIWLLLRRWPPLLVLGAVGNAGIVALWTVDRIWGLPLGPTHWKPDPVGLGDSVSSAFEIVLVALCVALLARRRAGRLQLRAALALASAVLALTALSLLSVLGVAPSILPTTV